MARGQAAFIVGMLASIGEALPDMMTLPPVMTLPPMHILTVPPLQGELAISAPFNCSNASEDHRDWSLMKQEWCCRRNRTGCKPGPTPSPKTQSTSHTEAGQVRTSLGGVSFQLPTVPMPTTSKPSSSVHELLVFPSSAPLLRLSASTPVPSMKEANSTTTPAVPTRTGTTSTHTSIVTSTCEADCKMSDASSKPPRVATCRSHIHQVAFHNFLGDPDSCPRGRDIVAGACPVCKACPLVAAGCVLDYVTTMAPTIKRGPPCQADCMFAGYKATCGSRILWTNANSFAGKADSCSQAYKLVRTQCQHCGECTPIRAGCAGEDKLQQSRTPPPEFDCNVDPDDMKRWPASRTKWCCENKKVGCQHRIRVLRKFNNRLPPLATSLGSSLPGMSLVLFMACFCSLIFGVVVAVRHGYVPRALRQRDARQYAKVPECAALMD